MSQRNLIKNKVLYISYDGLMEPLSQSQVLPYLRGLAKDYRIYLITYEKCRDWANREERNKMKAAVAAAGINWFPLRYHKTPRVPATFYDLAAGLSVSIYLALRYRIKIVHGRNTVPSILAFFLKKLLGLRFVFDYRGFWADERRESGLVKSSRLYRFLKFIEKKLIQNADAIIVLANTAKEEMSKWPFVEKDTLNRITRITTCADLDKFYTTYKKRSERNSDINNRCTFVFFGSIGIWYPLSTSTSFINFIYDYMQNSFFKIFISNGTEEILEYINATKKDISRFDLRFIPYKDLQDELVNTDIGFFFIPPQYSKRSSMPTKLGEMLASGIPVITSHSIGDIDKIIRDNQIGYIIEDFSEQEYQKAVNYVVNMIRQEKNKLIERCRKAAEENFSLKNGAEKYSDIYRMVLK